MGSRSRAVRSEGPLRVMFVVPHMGRGGAERHVATLVPAMDPTRFAPSVVALAHGGLRFDDLQRAGGRGVALHRKSRDVLGTLRDLVRLVRRERPDVIVTRGFNAEALGGLAAVLTRTPRLVVWVHNCGDLGGRPPHRRLVDRLLARVVSAVYGVAHGQVPYITEDLGYPPEKVRVVQNGADLSDRVGDDERDEDVAREFGIAPDEPIIGITAVLRTEKDHPNLLRAMRIVLAEQPRARLLVIGDGPERTATEKLAAELGLADRTVFTGYRDDVPRLLRGLDVFTLSSRIVECFPMALLESMAAARPAVCTAVGGIPEMIDDGRTGHVVPKEDPEALAEGLLRVLRDPAAARAMGRAARERLEREFSLERSIREAQVALEETAGRVPG